MQKEQMLLIDGNYSFFIVGECKSHRAFLTQGLVDTHGCERKQCSGFRKVNHGK